ncbi:hypothetical protein K440DRAFT_542492, partial [Wilcoxina mikolae CBS 423.85]
LTAKYPTSSQLSAYLKTLDKTHVEGLLLRAAFPEASANLQHCIYCHKTFNAKDNRDCKIVHFADLDDSHSNNMQFNCCGQEVSYADYDDRCHPPPEDSIPYCYTGPHYAKPIRDGELEEINGIKWWEEFKEYGVPCAKKKCFEKGVVEAIEIGSSSEEYEEGEDEDESESDY